MSRSRVLLLALILISMILLVGAVFLAALPSIVRALPGRYAYYLPAPLQEWRHVEHPEILPTAIPQPTNTPPPTATPAPIGEPSPTPTPEPTPTPPPTATPALPSTAVLEGVLHEPQGWNNCGPVTLGMALSYWGRTEGQQELAPLLKPDPEDKNVSPDEMVTVIHNFGMGAVLRPGGDLELLKRLVVAGFPVIVETWYVRDPSDQMGHYRLIAGYDDEMEEFLTYDSLHGPTLTIGYQELEELWRAFNHLYVIPYALDREAELAAVLGPVMDEETAFEHALATAREEALNPPTDCVAYADCADGETFAWFNVGTNLTALGQYEEAAAAYDRARVLGLPFRMLWYQFGPYEAYYAVGRYEDVITLADATLRVASNLEESYYWRGKARLALGDVDGARSDFEAALRYHPDWSPALDGIEECER